MKKQSCKVFPQKEKCWIFFSFDGTYYHEIWAPCLILHTAMVTYVYFLTFFNCCFGFYLQDTKDCKSSHCFVDTISFSWIFFPASIIFSRFLKTNIKYSHRQKQQKICLYFIDSQQYGGIRLGSILFSPLLKTDCGEDAENENKLFF